jgi:uncharacterized membrane protein
MFGLTSIGIVHTVISLVAVIAGGIAFLRFGEIPWRSRIGRFYVLTTVLTCLTGFFIFQHGGFGKPHILGVFTLLVLGAVFLAVRGVFGQAARYVETIGLTFTFFLHFIPGATETLTRLPLGHPVLPNADAPQLQAIVGVLFLLFLVGAVLQFRRLRRHNAAGTHEINSQALRLAEPRKVNS